MTRHRGLWILSIILGCLIIAATISFFLPLVGCSSCSGVGRISLMGSHPEAMGAEMSRTGRLIEVACSTCDGKGRMTLCHLWTGERPDLSEK